jgi:hypothetical protein
MSSVNIQGKVVKTSVVISLVAGQNLNILNATVVATGKILSFSSSQLGKI